MTPDETPPETPRGETPREEAPRFRERRSAFIDSDEEKAPSGPDRPAPPAASPEVPEPSPAAREETDTPIAGPAPERPEAAAEPGPAAVGEGVDLDSLDALELPDPTFYEIVNPLFLQGLQFLGVEPVTESGERRVLPRWAKHMIDLLGILEERTRGNLGDEEREYLEAVLHELRTRYLKVAP